MIEQCSTDASGFASILSTAAIDSWEKSGHAFASRTSSRAGDGHSFSDSTASCFDIRSTECDLIGEVVEFGASALQVISDRI